MVSSACWETGLFGDECSSSQLVTPSESGPLGFQKPPEVSVLSLTRSDQSQRKCWVTASAPPWAEKMCCGERALWNVCTN